VLVSPHQHAGDRAAGAESLETTSQAVEREQPREVHDGVVTRETPFADAGQRDVRAVPGERRIDDQQRPSLPAVAVRNQQRARADVDLAGERRDAQEIDRLDGAQGEQALALCRRPDDVVIGQRAAVIPVRAGIGVSRQAAPPAGLGRIGAHGRNVADDTQQL